jgi:gas vesicle protein
MKKSSKRFAIGTMLAAATGYLAGILTAPKSGRETREDIKDTTVKSINAAEKELKKLHTQLADLLAQAKDRASKVTGKAREDLDAAVGAAKQAKEKARDILTAIHEGDAEDKDLQKAVTDAETAINHLKTFLTK